MRFWHNLKHNKNSETVHQLICVDTETKPIQISDTEIRHKLWFGWACYKKRTRHGKWSKGDWHRFETPASFWEWCNGRCRAKTKLWVFAHNTNFDLPVLETFTVLPSLGYSLSSAIIDGPPTVLKYERRPQTIIISDSLNIWRTSLAALGERFGLEKLEMPVSTATPEEWDVYCKRDVEVLQRAIIEWLDFLRDRDLGGFTPTLAAQSMRTYRHKYMKHAILIDNHVPALKVSRAAYHGGRCEAFRIGGPFHDIYCVDVNSMYPFCMREYPLPYRFVDYRERLAVRDLPRYLDRGAVCAEVDLTTDHAFAAVVHDNKLVFPTGSFRCSLSTPELRWALSHATITAVHRLALYESDVLFREMVDDLYTDRLECQQKGDKVQAWLFKILLNSFYGKWGQNGRKWRTIGECEEMLVQSEPYVDMDEKVVTKIRKIGGLEQILEIEDESSESHPAIAAHITAYARMHLFALMRKLSPQDYLYCDTDSLYVTEQGFHVLRDEIDEIALGKLKLVDHYEEVFIYGAKDLICDGKPTLKGIRKTAQQVDMNTYVQEKWSSLKGILREGRLDLPSTKRILKHLRREYTKGVVGADGFVTPLHFPLGEG